jgi:hypothetical protein
MKWTGLVAYMEGFVHKILTRNPEVNTPLGSPRHTIKMDLRDIVWECLGCVHMAYDRDQWSTSEYTAMEFWVP